jgi:hypothetical protein
MVLHYSINFENGFITHHGETKYPLNLYQNTEPYIDSMTAFVKADLTKSIKKWGFTPDDMIKAEFYFYRMAEEVIFFSWEKEIEVEGINK